MTDDEPKLPPDPTPPARRPIFIDEEEDTGPDPGMPQYHRGRVFLAGFTVFLLIVTVISIFSCGPRKGSILYGICKTYLQQSVPYPETIVPTNVEQYPSATRIYYTSVDPFGQFKLEQIECVYAQDPNGNMLVQKILMNRQEVEADKVKAFSDTLPAVVAGKPDLTLPEPQPDINQILEEIDD